MTEQNKKDQDYYALSGINLAPIWSEATPLKELIPLHNDFLGLQKKLTEGDKDAPEELKKFTESLIGRIQAIDANISCLQKRIDEENGLSYHLKTSYLAKIVNASNRSKIKTKDDIKLSRLSAQVYKIEDCFNYETVDLTPLMESHTKSCLIELFGIEVTEHIVSKCALLEIVAQSETLEKPKRNK